jgi:hypothetical protein
MKDCELCRLFRFCRWISNQPSSMIPGEWHRKALLGGGHKGRSGRDDMMEGMGTVPPREAATQDPLGGEMC